MEPACGLAVENQHHQRPQIEPFAVGDNLQRHGVYRAELLDSFDDIGQFTDPVFAFVGRMLGRGGEDAERKDIDEIEPVHPAYVDPVHGPRSDLPRRFERFTRHADRAGEIVGRTGGNHSERDVQPLVFHGVDHVVDRAVAACDDQQPERLVSVERIDREIDRLRRDFVSVSLENRTDAPDIAGDLSFARPGIVEKYRCFHDLIIS